jgi:hypothetical protein
VVFVHGVCVRALSVIDWLIDQSEVFNCDWRRLKSIDKLELDRPIDRSIDRPQQHTTALAEHRVRAPTVEWPRPRPIMHSPFGGGGGVLGRRVWCLSAAECPGVVT